MIDAPVFRSALLFGGIAAALAALILWLVTPSARSIMRDLATPPVGRCASAGSHDMRPACMVSLRATALNGRHLSGATCHGDLGAPAVRMLG
jgi:hypothetical protein